MDPYTFSLTLGAVGFGAMALTGMARGAFGGCGHGGHAGHTSIAGHAAHAGHAGAAHSHGGHIVPHGASHGHAHLGGPSGGGISRVLSTMMSPRVLFGFLIGFGATGLLGRSWVPTPLGLGVLALIGGAAFERLVVTPLWNWAFRFESAPALTLESTLFDEAKAVTGFDANGQGIVALEVDGQVVQILGTLSPEERARGVRVHAGAPLRVEAIDAQRNRCTVSAIST